MTRVTGRAARIPPTPEQLVERQGQRRRLTILVLGMVLGFQAIMLLGGGGLWLILGMSGPQVGATAEQLQTAQYLLPVVRLMTLHTVLLLLLTATARRMVSERRSAALGWFLGMAGVMVLAFPFGTVTAPLLLLLLPPRRWADLRPRAVGEDKTI